MPKTSPGCSSCGTSTTRYNSSTAAAAAGLQQTASQGPQQQACLCGLAASNAGTVNLSPSSSSSSQQAVAAVAVGVAAACAHAVRCVRWSAGPQTALGVKQTSTSTRTFCCCCTMRGCPWRCLNGECAAEHRHSTGASAGMDIPDTAASHEGSMSSLLHMSTCGRCKSDRPYI